MLFATGSSSPPIFSTRGERYAFRPRPTAPAPPLQLSLSPPPISPSKRVCQHPTDMFPFIVHIHRSSCDRSLRDLHNELINTQNDRRFVENDVVLFVLASTGDHR